MARIITNDGGTMTIRDLQLFDVNCFYGRAKSPAAKQIERIEGLLAEMDFYGIREALVYHISAKEEFFAVGNEMLANELDDIGRVHPVCTAVPHHTGEIDPPEVFFKKMKSQGFCACRLFPRYHGFLLNKITCGEMLSTLEKYRMPLILDHFEGVTWEGIDKTSIAEIQKSLGGVTWDTIDQLLSDFPHLPFIVTNVMNGYGQERYSYPLLKFYKNLYLETSTLQVAGSLENICKVFGAERLIFGSGLPLINPGGPITQLFHADITWEEKKLIAGDNLRDILGQC